MLISHALLFIWILEVCETLYFVSRKKTQHNETVFSLIIPTTALCKIRIFESLWKKLQILNISKPLLQLLLRTPLDFATIAPFDHPLPPPPPPHKPVVCHSPLSTHFTPLNPPKAYPNVFRHNPPQRQRVRQSVTNERGVGGVHELIQVYTVHTGQLYLAAHTHTHTKLPNYIPQLTSSSNSGGGIVSEHSEGQRKRPQLVSCDGSQHPIDNQRKVQQLFLSCCFYVLFPQLFSVFMILLLFCVERSFNNLFCFCFSLKN